jgi:hypothetical protein
MVIHSRYRAKKNTITVFVLLLLILPSLLFASVTGKIKGRVTDLETGKPITGVNVILDNTYLGASTDIHGDFFILQIPPGSYTLRFSMIGYTAYRVDDVRVLVDLTTTLNAEMGSEALLGAEVVVTAGRPLIQADDASSTIFLSAEDLSALPIASASEALMLQAGIFQNPASNMYGGDGEESFAIRGGGQGQIKLYMDGVRNASLMGSMEEAGVGFSALNMHGISELQIITSGFSAEYGEAQSGVVNVVSKTGGQDYSASFELIQSPASQRHFGRNIYDFPTQEEYLNHIDENGQVDSTWLRTYDKGFWSHIDSTGVLDTLWMIPYREQQMYDYTAQEDYTLYYSLGGPVPGLQDKAISFFISGQSERKATALPRPRDTHDLNTLQANLRLPVGSKAILLLTGNYSLKEYSTLQDQGLFSNPAKFYRGYGSIRDAENYGFGLHWSHTLAPELFYELKLSSFSSSMHDYMGEYSPLGSGDTDQSIWGYDFYFIPEEYTDAQADSMKSEPYHMYTPRYESLVKSGDLSAVGSLTWQVDKYNQIKTGFEYRYNRIEKIDDYRLPPWTDDLNYYWNKGLSDKYEPIQLAVFLRDKMEFESMIMEVGLRYDRFDPNREWFDFSHWFNLAINPEYDVNMDPDLDQVDSLGRVKYSYDNILDKPMSDVDAFNMLSPRIGISFPISVNSKLAFNYGHFYQTPSVDKMFELAYFRPNYITEGVYDLDTSGVIDGNYPSKDGDPERVIFLTAEALKPQKTVQFEVKYEQVIQNLAKLTFTGYYKDISDQTYPRAGLFDNRVYGYDPFRGMITPNAFYVGNFPGDYGDARGLEVSLQTLFSKNIQIDLNYAFSAVSNGKASPDFIFIDADSSIEYEFSASTARTVESLNRPHLFRANAFFSWPHAWEYGVLGNMMKDVNLSLLYQTFSGSPYTYQLPEDDLDFFRVGRLEATQTVDLKVNKSLDLGPGELEASFRVTNLFNRMNHRAIGDAFFDADADDYYRKYGEPKTIDGSGYDITWLVYGEPRQYYFSLKYAF